VKRTGEKITNEWKGKTENENNRTKTTRYRLKNNRKMNKISKEVFFDT